MKEFTKVEKRKAVAREIEMRKRVYPRFVEGKKMKQEEADYQIAVFEEILKDYEFQ